MTNRPLLWLARLLTTSILSGIPFHPLTATILDGSLHFGPPTVAQYLAMNYHIWEGMKVQYQRFQGEQS